MTTLKVGELSKLPGSPQLHRWADWAELLCYVSSSERLTLSDLVDAANRRRGDRHIETFDEAEDDDKSEDIGDSEDEAELNDRQVVRCRTVFELLKGRQVAFGDVYPFEMDDGDALVVRPDTSSRLAYLFLLYCSSFRYISSKSQATRLASDFEIVSVRALRNVLPVNFEVHLFGSNSALPDDERRYKGLLIEKLRNLVTDLCETVRFEEDEFEPNDRGDKGLDMVAWLPPGDQLAGRIIIFGQCACTPKWIEKQHSSSADAFNNVMSLMSDPTNTCWIPYDFRHSEDAWYKRTAIHKSILFDRRRILSALGVLQGGVAGVAAADEHADVLDFDRLKSPRSADVLTQ